MKLWEDGGRLFENYYNYLFWKYLNLWIGAYHKVVCTQVAFHTKLVQWSGVVVAHAGLVRVEPHTHRHVVVAPETPDIEGHFET
jgi:hypothetical protein